MRWIVLDGRGTLPLDAATLDHLYDRWSPLRNQTTRGRRVVAACRKCNESRSNATTRRKHAIQVQRSAAGRKESTMLKAFSASKNGGSNG